MAINSAGEFCLGPERKTAEELNKESSGARLVKKDPYKCDVCGHGLAYVGAPCCWPECSACFKGITRNGSAM